ncbi:MAG: Eco57I restriction-modification methylase domain-containing protein [Acidobacteriota bacterium]|nr:Eco57I restriction-modification methylase domain-containing protein [Acidobacteriota bacterium]
MSDLASRNRETNRVTGGADKTGAVYTKPWVVELLLDAAGYCPEADLVGAVAIEPAAGHGVFLAAMALRLVASCRRQGRPLTDCLPALLAFEINGASAERARLTVTAALASEGVPHPQAERLACQWVHTGDYLMAGCPAVSPPLPPADFVIGNPPYIRLEHMKASENAIYRAAYPAMGGRSDLYIAFFEAALRQLLPGGACAFICADRWMLNQYGASLRRIVTEGYAMETLVEMHDADPFLTGVSAYPAITVIRRQPQGPAVVAKATRIAETQCVWLADVLKATRDQKLAMETAGMKAQNANISPPANALLPPEPVRILPGLEATRVETWFEGDAPWPMTSPVRLALLKRLERDFSILEDPETGTSVGIGVATGADELFITRNANLVEASRLLPLAMASDLSSKGLAWSGRYLVNPWDEEGLVSLAEFPRLAAYFQQNEAHLRQRHVGRRSPARWYRTIDRVLPALTAQPKLYIADIKDQLRPVLDAGTTYPHHNLYVVRSAAWDLEVLGGLLMSAIAQFFVECYSVRMRGGYLRFQAQYLRRIRVPHPSMMSRVQAQELKSAFRSGDRRQATQIALEIYGLADTERNALLEGQALTL